MGSPELLDYGLEPEKEVEDGKPETVPVNRTSIRRTRKGKDRRKTKPRKLVQIPD